ncbi:MAG TPA: polysaccharide deacetylase family protein [Candidatus Hydrogenedentes bacterium]|nr:polysaccharide deacetylase family protein [Candidatus Hydrogenedentota bacterium]
MPSVIKNGIKRSLKGTLRTVGYVTRTHHPTTRILTYHSIGQRRHEMNVTPENFRSQMAWLAQHANVISLRDAAEGKPGVAITFDDGYQDNLLNAAPVLKEFGFPAIVFIVAGKTGSVIAPNDDPQTSVLMTWDEVRALEGFGVEIGAHGMTHRRLSELSEDEQGAEILESKRIIEAELGHPIRCFAYPYGSTLDYTELTFSLTRKAGFRYAVSNRYGIVPVGAFPWELRRIWIDATDSLASFKAKVDGRLDMLSVLDSPAGSRWRKRFNTLLGLR